VHSQPSNNITTTSELSALSAECEEKLAKSLHTYFIVIHVAQSK
jgi:hypothetical protein